MPNITRHLSFTSLLVISSLSWAADSNMPTQDQNPMQGQGQMQGQMHEKMQQRIKAMDTNGDGNISKAEFQANGDKHFQKMDSNGDGQISAQERSQMMQQRKGQGGGQTPRANGGQNNGESFP
jgi:hypothetical protein